jgi:hypothetical protein
VAAAQAVLREIAAKGRDQLLAEGKSDAAIESEIAQAMTVMAAFLNRDANASTVADGLPSAAKPGGPKRRRRGTAWTMPS